MQALSIRQNTSRETQWLEVTLMKVLTSWISFLLTPGLRSTRSDSLSGNHALRFYIPNLLFAEFSGLRFILVCAFSFSCRLLSGAPTPRQQTRFKTHVSLAVGPHSQLIISGFTFLSSPVLTLWRFQLVYKGRVQVGTPTFAYSHLSWWSSD